MKEQDPNNLNDVRSTNAWTEIELSPEAWKPSHEEQIRMEGRARQRELEEFGPTKAWVDTTWEE